MSPTLWLVASSLGGAVLVVLAVVYRRALARHQLELAEAVIDAEYRELSGSPPAALPSDTSSPRAP
jgi:hypothetical protein